MWTVREIIQVAFVLRVTTKKVVKFFGEEKCTSDKILTDCCVRYE